MIRTVISLNVKEKAWLDKVAKDSKVSMSEIICRTVACYRQKQEAEAQPD